MENTSTTINPSDQSSISTSLSTASVDPLVHLSNTLTYHQHHLIQLYTSLGHSEPTLLVAGKITELHTGILKTIEAQAKQAESEVEKLTKSVEDLSDHIQTLRARLNHHSHHHLDLEPLDGKEALVPRLERLQNIERDLLSLKCEREVQAENLIQVLEGYIPTLGKDYITPIIHGPNPDSGRSGTDLSLEYIQKLEKHCIQCEREVSARSGTLAQHFQAIFDLWGDLGISPTLAPLSSSIEDYDQAQFDAEVLLHLGFEGITVTDNGDIASLGQRTPIPMQPTLENLARAEARRLWLETETSKRGEEIQRCYDELCPIWVCLDVPEESQEEFVEQWSGLSLQCVEAYQSELARMIELRKEHMVQFVDQKRQLIIQLWDQMYVSEEERAEVEIMSSSCFSEELLAAHDVKYQELLQELEDRQPVLDLFDRYTNLLQEAHELQLAEKDPDRFAKGKRHDPGKLLREEKIRKRVTKEKPKLEAQLKDLIPQWENSRGRPFLINGSRYLDDLVTRLEQEAASKDQRTKTGTASAGLKRQQTGTQSRNASPVKKRTRSGTVSKPPVSGAMVAMRGNANPFGSATPGLNKGMQSASRIGAQPTGGSHYSMRSGTLHPQRTGSSMSNYNPTTPTPFYQHHGQPSRSRSVDQHQGPPSSITRSSSLASSMRASNLPPRAPSSLSNSTHLSTALPQTSAHAPTLLRPQLVSSINRPPLLPRSTNTNAPLPKPLPKPSIQVSKRTSFRPRPSSILQPPALATSRTVSISGSTNTIDSVPTRIDEAPPLME
ncbi:microtubule associated protein-domain-containing protein [Melampsora americana]|nr:microtubule associated protein-domain-containing protein [Melampsora americana]